MYCGDFISLFGFKFSEFVSDVAQFLQILLCGLHDFGFNINWFRTGICLFGLIGTEITEQRETGNMRRDKGRSHGLLPGSLDEPE